MLCQALQEMVEGSGEPPSAPELIHGLSNLPDGYGKTFDAAKMLLPRC